MNTPRSILLIVAALLVCDWSSATMRPVLAATRAPGTQLWVATQVLHKKPPRPPQPPVPMGRRST